VSAWFNQGDLVSGLRVACDGWEQSLVRIDVIVTVAGPYRLTIQERRTAVNTARTRARGAGVRPYATTISDAVHSSSVIVNISWCGGSLHPTMRSGWMCSLANRSPPVNRMRSREVVSMCGRCCSPQSTRQIGARKKGEEPAFQFACHRAAVEQRAVISIPDDGVEDGVLVGRAVSHPRSVGRAVKY
jgi:hypothetical protein